MSSRPPQSVICRLRWVISARHWVLCAHPPLAQFLEPMVERSSSKFCAAQITETARNGETFDALDAGCYHSLQDAILSAVALIAISTVKVDTVACAQLTGAATALMWRCRMQLPELMDMLRSGTTPRWPWNGWRCLAEWFSLLIMLAYHNSQEHALVRTQRRSTREPVDRPKSASVRVADGLLGANLSVCAL